MALLLQNMQGDIKSHLLLNTDMANPNFEEPATKVEEYYRNVYIDNNYSKGVHGLKGKYGKGKDKGKKGKCDYNNTPKGKGYTDNYPPHQKGNFKEKKSTAHDHTTSKEEEKAEGNYNNYNKGRGKAKDQRTSQRLTTFHHFHRAKEKNQPKKKEREPTSFATTVENRDTRQTSVGGKDQSTASINQHHYGRFQTTYSLNAYDNCHLHDEPPSSASTTIMTQPQQRRKDHSKRPSTASMQHSPLTRTTRAKISYDNGRYL
eukprot:2508542-Amphidinium_carterae.1